MRSVKKVFVKYEDDGNYEELPYGEMDSVLLDGKESGKKYYTIADNAIFIFPMPKKDIEDGIVVHGNNTLKDLTTKSTEKEIWMNRMPSMASETLALGTAMRYVKYRKRDFTEAQTLEVEYEKEMNKIVATFKARSVRIYHNEPIPMRTDLQ